MRRIPAASCSTLPRRTRPLIVARARAALAGAAFAGAAVATVSPGRAGAQPAAAGEFTRQALLVLGFARGEAMDARAGRQAGDAVRQRIDRLANSRELELLGGGEVRKRLESAGFTDDDVFDARSLGHVARAVRADEFLVGRVSRAERGGFRLEAELRLVRDPWTRHPVAPATGSDLNAAADALARAVTDARRQLAPDRRCRNALRDGRPQQALAAVRAAIASGADGAFVRSCHVIALGAAGAPPDERLNAARALLALDPTSRPGLDGAARAYDLLRRRSEAAEHWEALAATDTTDYLLASQVGYALLDGGNARAALPVVARALRIHADSVGLVRLRWLAARDAGELPVAIEAGELLRARDPRADGDSTFLGQLAEAYRGTGQPIRALELAARGAARFPGDPRLYALYAKLILAERDTVVPRGLARFPKSAPLHVLAAGELKARGQAEQALAATRVAVALDSTLPQGILAVAQAEYELGRPDSALVALRRALVRGEDTSVVAQFALAKGNALLRAANQTRTHADLHRALRFLALGDSARPTAPSKLVLGTAALAYAQALLLDVPRAAPAARCTLARDGAGAVATARAALAAGESAAPDAARQYLGFAAQMGPTAERALMGCGGAVSAAATAAGAPARAPAARPAADQPPAGPRAEPPPR